jgi:hypothetical protein
MAKAAREFRTQESLDAENESRDAVVPFLESRGFKVQGDQRSKRGTAQSQVISAIDPEGKAIKLRVRLCWRKQDHDAMRISLNTVLSRTGPASASQECEYLWFINAQNSLVSLRWTR